MVLVDSSGCMTGGEVKEDWPVEVEFIISALEAAGHDVEERRAGSRRTYRVSAHLKLFSQDASESPWVLYTRDMGSRSLGFITRDRLALGYGGTVSLVSPQGRKVQIGCTVLRCREAANGWFEGALQFNRFQADFI